MSRIIGRSAAAGLLLLVSVTGAFALRTIAIQLPDRYIAHGTSGNMAMFLWIGVTTAFSTSLCQAAGESYTGEFAQFRSDGEQTWVNCR